MQKSDWQGMQNAIDRAMAAPSRPVPFRAKLGHFALGMLQAYGPLVWVIVGACVFFGAAAI